LVCYFKPNSRSVSSIKTAPKIDHHLIFPFFTFSSFERTFFLMTDTTPQTPKPTKKPKAPKALPKFRVIPKAVLEQLEKQAIPKEKVEKPVTRSGFVALIGRPNVGKSTLLNQLLGEKVAITSPVMQTTRHRIRGVMTEEGAQLIVLDTPGFSKPIDNLGTYIVDESQAGLREADFLVLVMDATEAPGDGDAWLVQQATMAEKPLILVLNKTDRLRQNLPLLNQRSEAYQGLFGMRKPVLTLRLSARTGKQVPVLKQQLLKLLPAGPAYYEADALTDQRMREMSAELIREQVLRLTSEELPHSVAIGIETFDETSDPERVLIVATLYVNQTSQKPILVGAGASMIKAIGTYARKNIETLVGRKVHLDLTVKVKKNWRKDDAFLKTIGLALPS
jgi:GTP-binding protein Era